MASAIIGGFTAIAGAVTGATAAVTGSAALAAAVGNAIIGAGTFLASWQGALLVSQIAAATLLAPDVNREGSPTEWRPDPDAGIPVIMGRAGFSGRIIHMDEHGDSNRYLTTVNLLSVGPVNGEEKLRADRVDVTFGAGTVATSPAEYANKMWRVTSLGLKTQSTAFTPPTLLKDSPGIAGWDANSILPGLAHSVWTLQQDSKFKSYPAGAPAPLWIIQGTKLYDPRKDSTYPGGSGSHRLDDESTWEYTENPGLHALAWGLGYAITDPNTGDELTIGIGASLSSINVPALIELANVCDTNGWKVSAVASSRDDKHQVLKAILQSGGARYDSLGGKISCVARTPRTSVATISAADTAGPFEIDVNADRLTRKNTIIPRCVQEDHEWQMTVQPVVTDASYVTADGGELRHTLDMPYVAVKADNSNKDQPAELAAYALVDSRESIAGSVPLMPHMAQIEPGDIFTVTEPGFLLDGVELQCVRRTIDPVNNVVTIAFISESAGKHDYALGKTQTPPTPPGLSAPDIRTVAAPAPDAFNAFAGTDRQPTIVVTAADADEAYSAFIIQLRTVNDPETGLPWADADAGWETMGEYDIATERVLLTGVEPETAYQPAIRYVNEFGIAGERLVLASITTGDLNATLVGSRPSQDIFDDFENLAEAVLRSNRGYSDVQRYLEEQTFTADGQTVKAALIEESGVRASAIDAEAAARLALATVVGDNQAAFLNEVQVRSTLTDTFGGYFTLLGAVSGDQTAWVLNESTVQTGSRGLLATYFAGLETTDGTNTTQISLAFSAIGDQEARAALEVNVNGIITGIEIDGITQEFIISAAALKLQSLTAGGDPWVPFTIDGTSGAATFGDTIQLVPAQKLIRFAGSALGADSAVSFGSSFGTDNLIAWLGPKTTAAGSELKADGLFWIDDQANAFFGGEVSARYFSQVSGAFTETDPRPPHTTTYALWATVTIPNADKGGVLQVNGKFFAINTTLPNDETLGSWKLTAQRSGGGSEITIGEEEFVAITEFFSVGGVSQIKPRAIFPFASVSNPFDDADLPDGIIFRLYLRRVDDASGPTVFPFVAGLSAVRLS